MKKEFHFSSYRYSINKNILCDKWSTVLTQQINTKNVGCSHVHKKKKKKKKKNVAIAKDAA